MSLQNFYQVCSKISHTHTHTHTRSSSSSFIVTLSLIQRRACARAQFSRCSSTTNAHSETGQMAVCQNLMLGALSSCSTLSLLVGTQFKKFGIFLNMPCNLFSCSCYTALLTKFSLERRVLSEVSNVLLIFKCAAAKLLFSPKSVWNKLQE